MALCDGDAEQAGLYASAVLEELTRRLRVAHLDGDTQWMTLDVLGGARARLGFKEHPHNLAMVEEDGMVERSHVTLEYDLDLDVPTTFFTGQATAHPPAHHS